MIALFIILGLALLIPDAYIVFGVLKQSSWWIQCLVMVPTLAYYVVLLRIMLGYMNQNVLNWLLWLTLCVFLTTIIFAVISAVGKGVGLFWHGGPAVFNWIALALSAGWLAICLYGIVIGWKKVMVESVEISSSRIPESFDGYKIVQLSDFHIGTYQASPQTVERIVDRVNSLNPDLIVFTGDIVNVTSEEMDQFKDVLKRLKARDGILSVLGNHDYCLYKKYKAPDTPLRQLGKVIENEKEIGWRLLRNESVKIRHGNGSIAVIGVDNAGIRMSPDKSDLPKAMQGIPADEYKILLSHDPSHWRREVLPTTDIDLTLSGHTHAMQFKIGNWSPSKWAYPEWGGMYAEEAQRLYVSTGVGENIAFRFGAYPQIVVLTLRR